MVRPVEETLQIQIHHPIIPGQDVFLGALYRLMRAAFRTKAIAVVRKRRVEEWLQDLQHRLLNHPVHHRRDTEPPLAALRFRNLYLPYRLGLVAAFQQFLTDPVPVRLAIRLQPVNGYSVDAWRTAIAHHALIGCRHILTAYHCLHRYQSPVPGLLARAVSV